MAQSLQHSQNVVEDVIHKICRKAWEREVVTKKDKHTVDWIFSVTQDMYYLEPDKKLSKQTEREDRDEEPVRFIAVD
jgi:hypothetical protein